MVATVALGVLAATLAIDKVMPHETPEPNPVFAQFLKQAPGPIGFVLTGSSLAAMSSWRDAVIGVDQYASREFTEEGARTYDGNPQMQQISNPWAWRFDSGLNFQFEMNRIVNLKPAAEEAAEYRNEGTVKQWSRIALVRNLPGSGWVLLVAGLRFESIEGAGEFLLRPESLAQVRRLLHAPAPEPLPPFELLLETRTLEGTSHSSHISTWRRH